MQSFNYDDFGRIPLPSESEVMSYWKGDSDCPVVSVVCITYNQKGYLPDTLRGILMQKTEFPFEILIHDDASTDGSRQLLEDYAQRYPRIIRLILQDVNQYSQGRRIMPIAVRVARGEFVALCEGDDFWLSDSKLQMQIAAMQSNPTLNVSFHPSLMGNTDDGEREFKPTAKSRIIYPTKQCIFTGKVLAAAGGGLMPTASIVTRRKCLDALPDWFAACPVADYFIEALTTEPDGALFLPYYMSFYRTSAVGSWTVTLKNDEEKKAQFWASMTRSLDALNAHLALKYQSQLKIYWAEYTMRLIAESEYIRAKGRNVFDTAGGISQWSTIADHCLSKNDGIAKLYSALGYRALRVFRIMRLWTGATLVSMGLTKHN